MPPAEKATTARIGLVGHACAHASPLVTARLRTDSNARQIRVTSFTADIGQALAIIQAFPGRSATWQQL
jgi:hypothetical protein